MTVLRNLAIIAHVDHGKTTLIDALLQQSGAVRAHQQLAERAMDSNDLERERGITILAKCTAVAWKDYRLNIVDTPGHADFGGEVERILDMVDGALLLVDSAESVRPQTKFVLSKALAKGLRPIVVVNKMDRPDARPDTVLDEVFDLFAALGADEHQLDFPVAYASGRSGWASMEPVTSGENLHPLLDLIVAHVPAPDVDRDAPFTMLATMIESDPYIGRVLTGRVASGIVKMNQAVRALRRDGTLVEDARITKILRSDGLKREAVEQAEAGDIVSIAGLSKTTVADTIGAVGITEPLAARPIDPPTMAVSISVNDSPLAGQEGDKVTSRMIRDRLFREAESNVAIRVTELPSKDAFEVAGRGELQLGVLVETMRREGFEMSISRPRVLFRENAETGQLEEPIEEVHIDVDEEYSGVVVEKMSLRRAEMTDMRPSGGGKTRIVFMAPSRGLIGYRSEFLSDTRGTGVLNRLFSHYGPHKGEVEGRRNGVLVSNGTGEAVAYALWNLEERGILFVEPQTRVYGGMVIGEHSRGNDLDVNPLKAKQLTNIRSAGKDDAIRLTPPKIMSLEEAIAYIDEDELIEVTPKSIRLRKRFLDPNDRKKAARAVASA
ncbi:translational GTPase TypA [Tistrella mobilis]|uniref:translational GTPase TypA n=1 Tax=Tistrella mobilis TaxID=171437 RepID=UPI003558B670